MSALIRIQLVPQHIVPNATWRHDIDRKTKKALNRGYYRWPMDWRAFDSHLIQLTSTGSLIAEWIRLLAGLRLSDLTVDRTFESAITLDGLSLGFDHFWSKYIPKRFAWLARNHPHLCAWAWGAEAAEAMKDPAWLGNLLGTRRWKHRREQWPGDKWSIYEWFIAGWYEIARHPAVLRYWINETAGKLKGALKTCRQRGWRATDELLALVARASNSYGVRGFRNQIDDYLEEHPYLDGDPMRLIRAFYDDEDEYDKPRRDDLIIKMFGEDVVELEDLDADDLDWSAEIVRFDGTKPRWVREGIEIDFGAAP